MPYHIIKKIKLLQKGSSTYLPLFGVDLEDDKTWSLFKLYRTPSPEINGEVVRLLDLDGVPIDNINKSFEFPTFTTCHYTNGANTVKTRLLHMPQQLVQAYGINENMAIELILKEVVYDLQVGEKEKVAIYDKMIEGPKDILPKTNDEIDIKRTMPKQYYAQRKGVKPEPFDFEMLKKAFILKFEKLEEGFYFRQATGYECVDEEEPYSGLWGKDPETFFFFKLRMRDIWPIPKNIDSYDELKLFTVIEFLYDYVSEPQKIWHHKWNNCGYHTEDYDVAKGKARYRKEINDILKDYKSGYELSDSGQILECPPDGFEGIFKETETTSDPKNIDERVKTAILEFRKYSATTDEKKMPSELWLMFWNT
jgi:hypothetical protein